MTVYDPERDRSRNAAVTYVKRINLKESKVEKESTDETRKQCVEEN